jgi:iron complex outermembrane receptor protein
LKRFTFIIWFFYAGWTSGLSQVDTLEIEELTIISQRVPCVYSGLARLITILPESELQTVPATTFSELLETAPNIDVRQRGAPGLQADINLSGGSFDQSLILINGIPLNDPQSGHHSFNLPVAFDAVNRVEILNGSGARVLGPNAFSGAVNFITGSAKKSFLSANVSAGQFGYFQTGFSGSVYTGKFQSFISVSTGSSNGYMENTDYRKSNYYYHGAAYMKNTSVEFQAGYQDKAFGANSFYTPKFPNQYEQIRSSLVSLKVQTGNLIKFRTSVYWKRNKDRFELFRIDPPEWYGGHNHHLTNVYGMDVSTWLTTAAGKSSMGVDFRQEDILSNVLGKSLGDSIPVSGEKNAFYYKGDSRRIYSVWLEQSGNIRKFSYSGGIMLNWFSGFKTKVYGGLDLSYGISENHRLYVSVNHSNRLPTYTDLYYTGPVNVGNSGLKPEEALTVETAYTYMRGAFQIRSSVFFRKGMNIIDWVRFPDSFLWESRNITELKTTGISLSGTFQPENILNKSFYLDYLRLSYTYQLSAKQSGDFYSRYVMDYLRHKADLVFKFVLFKGFSIHLTGSFQDRAGTYTSFESGEEMAYSPVFLLNTRLNWKAGWFHFFGEAMNLLNQKYYDYGNVPLPGRWLRAGLIVTWNPGN